MCRNIRTLYNFEPPATAAEVEAAAVQFVRKVSGFSKPSQANQPSFDTAVTEVAAAVHKLMGALTTNAPAKNREAEAQKAKLRSQQRFGSNA